MDTVVYSYLAEPDADDAASTAVKAAAIVDSKVVELAAICFTFGLPLFIVALILWFRHKNRQARYRLAAKALEAGQPIPTSLLDSPGHERQAVLSKGIKNICLGVGLMAFLWLLTGEEGVAAVGLVVLSLGVGQVLVACVTGRGSKEDKPE